MAKTQWLQCTIPMEHWQKLNERRLNLGLTWSALLEPAVNEYLDELEAAKSQDPTPVTEATPTATKAPKGKGKSKGKKQPGEVKPTNEGEK